MTVREAAYKGFIEAGLSDEAANRLLEKADEHFPEFTKTEVPQAAEEWAVNHAKKRCLFELATKVNRSN